MALDNSEHPSVQHLALMASRLGPGCLALELVDQRARTTRARVRDRTMVDLAVALRGTGAEIAVSENDGSTWEMTLSPHRVRQNGQGTTA